MQTLISTKTEDETMPKGGKRPGSGRKPYSSEFVEWVWTSVRNAIQETAYERVKFRATRPQALTSLLRRLEEDDTQQTEDSLEVALAWKDNLAGQQLLDRLTVERGVPTTGVYISADTIPAPNHTEMSAIYAAVARKGSKLFSHCTPQIVKRVWLQTEAKRKALECLLKKERSKDPLTTSGTLLDIAENQRLL
jgi:hypothetical protein